MLSFLGRRVRLCDGLSRREVPRVGGLGFSGLLWSDLLRARAAAGTPVPRAFGRARACILVFNYGGPSHLDLWDLKPDAPREIRGEFDPIATRVPGTSISEHLPRLAAVAGRYAILRSVSHPDNDHAVGTYLALTGYPHPRSRPLGVEPAASPLDMPSLGSVVSKLRPPGRPIFPYITLSILSHFGNHDGMGQGAGCLGKVYDPFTVPDGAKDPGESVPAESANTPRREGQATVSSQARPKPGGAGPGLGTCPLCGSEVVEQPRSYGCIGWRGGCRFAIWKTIAGKRISPLTAQALLRRGRSPMLKGFRSRSGRPFEARLKLEEGAVRFDFGPETE
jgi:hypothetical protein